jgi:hypothetical protein
LHHGMNSGINGDEIFSGNKNKTMFLDLCCMVNAVMCSHLGV